MSRPVFAALVFAAAIACFGSLGTFADAPASPAFVPTSHYEERDVEGWKVLVHRKLLNDEKELGGKALHLLRVKLFDIVRLVPARHVAEMQKVPIWLEYSNPQTTSAQYHPDRQWLVDHDFNPDKAKCVEIAKAENLLKEERRQPFMMLHELAHAYHNRVLSFDEPRIKAAYDAAVERKLYEDVLNFYGKNVKHYALTNHKEFFAELTECYFGTNDFFPFVRPELKQHDPATFQLLEAGWGE